MALNIRNEECEALAAELAELTGETKTQAIAQALRERLERERKSRRKRDLREELDAIANHCASLPVLDPRSIEEIMDDMYDEDGIPH